MNNNKTLKPYLIQAFYKWALEHNLTPLIEIANDYYNLLPEHVKRQQLAVLNIHPDAIHELKFTKQYIDFEAMFSNSSFNVKITYESIRKVFIKEDGYGLEFSVDQEKIRLPYKNESKIKQTKHLKLVKS